MNKRFLWDVEPILESRSENCWGLIHDIHHFYQLHTLGISHLIYKGNPNNTTFENRSTIVLKEDSPERFIPKETVPKRNAQSELISSYLDVNAYQSLIAAKIEKSLLEKPSLEPVKDIYHKVGVRKREKKKSKPEVRPKMPFITFENSTVVKLQLMNATVKGNKKSMDFSETLRKKQQADLMTFYGSGRDEQVNQNEILKKLLRSVGIKLKVNFLANEIVEFRDSTLLVQLLEGLEKCSQISGIIRKPRSKAAAINNFNKCLDMLRSKKVK